MAVNQQHKFTSYKFDVLKPVIIEIDILNGITLELSRHNLAPEVKLVKFVEVLNVLELKALLMNISMRAEPSWNCVRICL